jgi:hypothetical protein
MYEMCTGQPFYGKTDLAFQVSLAMDSEDYNTHLEERLQLIEHEDLRSLCRDMLLFQHELRPEAAEIADRADTLWRKIDGITLGKWARTTQWPDLSYDTAEFCGKRIDAKGVVVGNSPDPQPPEPEVPPPPRPGSLPSIPPQPPKAFGNTHTLDLTHPPPGERISAPMARPQPAAAAEVEAPPSSNAPLIIGAAAVFAGLAMFGIGLVALVAAIFLS